MKNHIGYAVSIITMQKTANKADTRTGILYSVYGNVQ